MLQNIHFNNILMFLERLLPNLDLQINISNSRHLDSSSNRIFSSTLVHPLQ
jgi:hypothetical protein